MDGGNQPGDDKQQAGWVFKPGGSAAPAETPQPQPQNQNPPQPAPVVPPAPLQDDRSHAGPKESVEWTASEFVAHQKGGSWYALLFLAAAIVAAIVFLVTREVLSTGVVLFAALVFAVAGAHKPRILAFRLDQSGLTIGQKFYPYSQFKSFAVIQDGAFNSVALMPLKRFMPSVDMYLPPDNADEIMDVLAANLPIETKELGVVDTFARRIRF